MLRTLSSVTRRGLQPLRLSSSLVDCSKVLVKPDAYGGAGAYAACNIARGEVVETGIVRVLTNCDGNEKKWWSLPRCM